MNAQHKQGETTSLAGRVTSIVTWLGVVFVIALITVTVVMPRVFGWSTYAVATGSMVPSLEPGALVIVRPVDVADLAIGDVITFQLEPGKAQTVTHRIVGMGVKPDGSITFETKGDANNVSDANAVIDQQIRGRVWFGIPQLGTIAQLGNGVIVSMLAVIVAVVLLIYAIVTMVSARGERGRKT